jgi:hypothetical protein
MRLVVKDSKKYEGERLAMAFVEFQTVTDAAAALQALQGYVFDIEDPGAGSFAVKYARPMENPKAARRMGVGERGGGRGRIGW